MKNIFILFLCFLSACHSSQQEPPVPSTATTGNNYEPIIRAYFDAFNHRQWEKFADFYADTAEFLDPDFGTLYIKKNHQDIINKYTQLYKLMPGVKDSVVQIYAAGDHLIAEFVAYGALPGYAGNYHLPLCSVFTFKDGKIIKDATYYDKSN